MAWVCERPKSGTICKWQHKRCQQHPFIKYEGEQESGIGDSEREGWEEKSTMGVACLSELTQLVTFTMYITNL